MLVRAARDVAVADFPLVGQHLWSALRRLECFDFNLHGLGHAEPFVVRGGMWVGCCQTRHNQKAFDVEPVCEPLNARFCELHAHIAVFKPFQHDELGQVEHPCVRAGRGRDVLGNIRPRRKGDSDSEPHELSVLHGLSEEDIGTAFVQTSEHVGCALIVEHFVPGWFAEATVGAHQVLEVVQGERADDGFHADSLVQVWNKNPSLREGAVFMFDG